MEKQIAELINEVRIKKPLVHHITNYVTVNDCANITLGVGASPVMADDIADALDIVSISSALVLNIGTLNERTIRAGLAAGKKANELNKPVVFDPVGAGASALRNNTVKHILTDVKCAVIKGNISEIKFIAGESVSIKGVDASDKDMAGGLAEGINIAKALAKEYGCVVGITGETDIVSNGKKTVLIKNGHKMLDSVTGTGCMCSSLVGAYCGATHDYFAAAVAGIASMGIAGELAYESAGKIGLSSFRTAVIDEISKLSFETIKQRAKINEAKN